MANFDLADYEPVESRIKRFYADHKDGGIRTELLSDANDISTTVVKAYLYVNELLVSTGMAFERVGEGYVNKTSHLENCETSAIGRALANYNYSGDKRPSREEMEKVERGEQGDSKVDALYKECRDMIGENLPDKAAHAKAIKWLDAHLKNMSQLTLAKKKLTERFATTITPDEEAAVEAAFDRADAELKGVGL
jgi:hypothetical protein